MMIKSIRRDNRYSSDIEMLITSTLTKFATGYGTNVKTTADLLFSSGRVYFPHPMSRRLLLLSFECRYLCMTFVSEK